MNASKRVAALITMSIIAIFPLRAFSAECGVPTDLKSIDFKKSNYFSQQVVLSSISKMSYEEAKSEFGIGVVYEGIPITANLSSFNSFKNAMQQNSYSNSITNNATEILKISGDSILLAAYQACIASNGGVTITLGTTGGAAFRHFDITYYMPANGKPETKVVSAINPNVNKGVTVLDGAECLTPGHVLQHLKPCRITLRFDGATTDAYFSVNTGEGPASGYFPPRLKLVMNRSDLPTSYDVAGTITPSVSWIAIGGNGTLINFCLAPLPEGYSVERSKAENSPAFALGVVQPADHGAYLNQQQIRQDFDPDGLYQTMCFSAQCAEPGGHTTTCGGTIRGKMVKLALVPDENFPQTAEFTK